MQEVVLITQFYKTEYFAAFLLYQVKLYLLFYVKDG
jgi:hypothetical protein